jgi:hypothetical protein
MRRQSRSKRSEGIRVGALLGIITDWRKHPDLGAQMQRVVEMGQLDKEGINELFDTRETGGQPSNLAIERSEQKSPLKF